jgi:PST family polysaccharide transporter
LKQPVTEHTRSLDSVFAGGLAWSAGSKGVTQILSWTSVLVAARLLATSDFGLAGMAGAFLVVTNVLAEFGIGSAVLQMQELERDVVAQIHTFACLMCGLVFLAAEAASPLIASFFKSERLLPVLLVNNIAFFLTGFQQVPLALMQQQMDYRRISLAEAASASIQALLTIAGALAGFGYWAIIAGFVLGKLAGTALNYYWQPIHFRRPRWKDIATPVKMGGQIAISRLAWSTYTQSDGIVVGRVLGASALGTYQMAMTLAAAPAEKVSTLVMRAAGPLFAKVQNDHALVRRYFLIIVEAMSLTVVPMMLGLAIVAPEAVRVVLGTKWSGAATPLFWLALFVILRTASVLCDQVLVALRQTRFTMGMSLLNLAVMPLSFFIASRWGVNAVAASWLILSPITILPMILKLIQGIRFSVSEIVETLMPGLAGSAVMVPVVGLLHEWRSAGPYPRLGVEISCGAAVYLVVVMGPFCEKVLRYFRFLKSLRQEQAILK